MSERSTAGVWIGEDDISVARLIAVDAMRAMGLDSSDFRLRDKIICAIDDRVDGTLTYVAKHGTGAREKAP